MKKVLVIFVFILFSTTFSFAQNPFKKSYRNFNIGVNELYLKSYSAISANKYEILEIQSDNGYILFNVSGRKFLLKVSPDESGSILKITPLDGDTSKGFLIEENIFKTIENEITTQVPKVSQ